MGTVRLAMGVDLKTRHADGSAGDANYGVIGQGYTRYRQPDPHIASFIARGLGKARTVLNVGAGAGSYEPLDRQVTAVEPSESMRAQRPAHLPAAIDAVAERLPYGDDSFDASMATFTVHQWPDLQAGLAEMRRVTRGPVLILSCDPLALDRFWLHAWKRSRSRRAAIRRSRRSWRLWAVGRKRCPSQSPWIAPTDLARRIMAGRSACSIPARDGRTRPGASSTRPSASASSPN
jgi:SAM-dependent methyltransferase